MVADLKNKKPSQWYSMLKRISSHDQHKSEKVNVEEINHLSDSQQAEVIAEKFAFIQNQFEPINPAGLKIPHYSHKIFPSSSRLMFGCH